MFKNLYKYRELLKTNIKKEIRGKYKGSFLGIFWSFINPLLQVVVYAIVFPYLLRNSMDNYLVYIITGLIPWTFFLQMVSQGTTIIKANGGIIKKVYFPREILPISVVASGLVNLLISCFIILIFCLIFHVGITWHIVFLPLIAVIETMLVLGLVFILSSINVYVQDVEYIIQFILSMLFYATPIVYDLSMFKDAGILATLINLNPMTQIINGYRDIFLYHNIPNFLSLGLVFLVSLVILVLGILLFKKLEKKFAEEL